MGLHTFIGHYPKEMNYSLQCIFSGYRCHYDNKIHRRSSTNHMGKALDLHFYRTTDKKKVGYIALKIMKQYEQIFLENT